MVLGLPGGRRCVFYCVLQIKLASGLKHLRFFNGFTLPRGFQEAPRGAPACQQRATAVSQARHKRVTGVPPFSFLQETRKRRSTQEALKRPSRGPQGAPKKPPRGLQETPKRPLRGLPEAPRGFKRPQEAPRGSPWLTVRGRRNARSA